jgi:uncharacterized membrane protein
MIEVTLYSKEDCHLCEDAISDLDNLLGKAPHILKVIDVNGDPALQEKYGSEVPVIEVGPYTLKTPFNFQDLEITLRAAVQREEQIQAIGESIETGRLAYPVRLTRSDRFSTWIARRYMSVLNILVLLYVGLPFLAPTLMAAGVPGPASFIYRAYGAVCHQLAFRSWFLFGEQLAYPRQAAGVEGLIPYAAETGLKDEDQLAARQFTGNPTLGYKVALCQRDIAIYGGILIFGLVFSLTGKKIKPIPWYLWLLVGIFPIAMDGFSQLLSQPPINLLSYRESTPLLRTITGFLFGLTTAWFGYPLVEETMVDIRQYYDKKFDSSFKQADSKKKRHALPPA